MTSEAYKTLVRDAETEGFIRKMTDIEPTSDFVTQFLLPTSKKVL